MDLNRPDSARTGDLFCGFSQSERDVLALELEASSVRDAQGLFPALPEPNSFWLSRRADEIRDCDRASA